MFNRGFFVWLSVFFLHLVTGHAATLTVTNTADDGSPGTLRATIAAANSNDTITFATNLSGQTILLNHTILELSNNLTIDASALANGLTITISNQSQSGLFVINSNVVVTMNNLILGGGAGYEGFNISGGAIYNSGTLTANNCTFADNAVSYDGGAIYNEGVLVVNQGMFMGNSTSDDTIGTSYYDYGGKGGAIYNSGILTVNQSIFTNNIAGYGSGGGIFNAGILTVNGSAFMNNNAYYELGGGICNSSNLIVTQSTFIGNLAGDGGGIYSSDTATVSQSTFIGDPTYYGFNAYNGGGIENYYGALTVKQSTFTDNYADEDGGGIDNFYGNLIIKQSTFTGNAAFDSGGGIDNEGGSFTLFNSIVAGNVITSGTDPDISGDISTNSGVNLVDVIPQLAPIGDYGGPTQTMPPLPGATNIIDAGSDTATNCFTTDQRGLPRLSRAHVDIGAAELQQGTATTLDASRVAATGATLNGDITLNDPVLVWYFQTGNDNSWFQYGTTTGYGNLSPATNDGMIYTLSANSNSVTVSQPVTGLSAGTTYHYQLLANGVCTNSGSDAVFTTLNFVIGTSPTLAGVTLSGGSFQFMFTNVANASFTVFASTNVALPFTQWTKLSAAVELPAGSGQYQFTDPSAGTNGQNFYRVCSP
jgi:predicted outer membrane repeat protein